MRKDIVGHGTLLVDGYGDFALKFTDGTSHYSCVPYSINSRNQILFHVIKLSEPDKDIRDATKKTVEEIRNADPFVFRLKGNKYVGKKGDLIYYAIKFFNNFIVLEESKYNKALDVSLESKIKKISALLVKTKLKLIRKT